MDEYAAKVARELVHNTQLATEISELLAKYNLRPPEGTAVVLAPQVIERPETSIEAIRILKIGIPAPELLRAAMKAREQFDIRRVMP
jgi:hypothetical protein